jgi:hypothetical protein
MAAKLTLYRCFVHGRDVRRHHGGVATIHEIFHPTRRHIFLEQALGGILGVSLSIRTSHTGHRIQGLHAPSISE